jgi:carbonic anhydrase/acetyltransferase-like protein (isoleucine patch superfamily)
MPAYQLDQFLPDIDPSCWIAPCATIIGNVVVGSGSSIWFGSVVRGDNEPIVIGERINIQDGCILHSDPGSPLRRKHVTAFEPERNKDPASAEAERGQVRGDYDLVCGHR